MSPRRADTRAWFRCSCGDLATWSEHDILGHLTSGCVAAGFESLSREQTAAWQSQIVLLKTVATALVTAEPSARSWGVLFEYEIPRRERRIDTVILTPNAVVVLEFKDRESHERQDVWQTEDYALDLRDFHAGTSGYPVVPVVVPIQSHVEAASRTRSDFLDVWICPPSALAGLLARLATECASNSHPPIDPVAWDVAPYRPTPTIVQATQHLFSNHSVHDLSHSYANNLSGTVDAIATAIEEARSLSQRLICFVTGVPGAGKTLAGLQAVHDQRVSQGRAGDATFMAGNGPLVRVLREALTRDAARQGMLRRDASRRAETLIENVHRFVEEYGVNRTAEAPHGHVAVYDEAQRAWNATKLNKRRPSLQVSEPTVMLDVMSRKPGWCAVIAIVGGGQEIHDGEAGLEEWGRAIGASPVPWRVLASPEVLGGGASVAGHRLFTAEAPAHVHLTANPDMHLDVSVRSPRAQRLADYVNAVLALDADGAQAALAGISGFRLALTRDLSTARKWLSDAGRGEMRPGLLASSGSLRHRAYGLELDPDFHRAYPIDRWFLDGPSDVRSSHSLEVALTEFECQGLEIDLAGVCWGDDLTVSADDHSWSMRRFRGSQWGLIRSESAQRYLINKYRVLLTRSREGMVIWVPPGDRQDPTRDPEPLDRTFEFLRRTGLPVV